MLVSKLLGFETFPFVLMVSVSKKIGVGKSFGFSFIQILGFVTHCIEAYPNTKEKPRLPKKGERNSKYKSFFCTDFSEMKCTETQ